MDAPSHCRYDECKKPSLECKMKLIRIIFCLAGFSLSSVCSFAYVNDPELARENMVVSEQKLATQAGLDILNAGGNAIDAAVAVGYALAVANPCCDNIGGGGLMTIHLARGKDIFLDFREKAPLKVSQTNPAIKDYLALTVPGTVLGLDTVLQKYGTMKRKQVMEPAIRLAGTRARNLQEIADRGPGIFYRGAIAQTLVKAGNAQGGVLTLTDFAQYTVQESRPFYCQYRGYTIISSSPPPSAGGVGLCKMLGVLEKFPLSTAGYYSLSSTRAIIEAMRNGLIHTNDNEYTPTTHYSVADGKGNAVAVTLNANVDGQAAASATAYAIPPSSRPLSSMTPTIVMKEGRVIMVLGSHGGPRTVTAVLLTLLNVIDFKMNIQQAVNTARFHFQGQPNTIFVEPFAFSYTMTKQLEKLGYSITLQPAMTAVEAIWIDPATKILQGANDWRRPNGAALGN